MQSHYETQNVESICSELTFCEKWWMIFAIYRPPDSANLNSFFNELLKSVISALAKYDNIIILGDLNVDTQNEQHPGYFDLKSEIFMSIVFMLSNYSKFNAQSGEENFLFEYMPHSLKCPSIGTMLL